MTRPSLVTRPGFGAPASTSCKVARLAVGVFLATCLATACGGQQGPARHPVAEMAARSSAKLEVIPLVVSDPERAERVRAVFAELAAVMVARTHAGAEQSAGLRKLLEAKDCAVRAALGGP